MKKRRTGMIALLCLGLTKTAGAAEWIPVADAPGEDRQYFDRRTLLIQDEEITYWRKVSFRPSQKIATTPVSTGLFRERLDCRARTLKTLGYLLYTDSGLRARQESTPHPEPVPLDPGSVGDAVAKALCPMAAEQPDAERRTETPAPRTAAFSDTPQIQPRLR